MALLFIRVRLCRVLGVCAKLIFYTVHSWRAIRRSCIWDRCRWRLHLVLGFRCRSGPGDETERTLVSHSGCIDLRLSLCP